MLRDLLMIKFTTNHDQVIKNYDSFAYYKLRPSFKIITNTLHVVRGITNYRKNYNSYYKLRQILTQNKCLHLYLIIRSNTTLAQLKPNLYSIYWLLLSYEITSLRDTHSTSKSSYLLKVSYPVIFLRWRYVHHFISYPAKKHWTLFLSNAAILFNYYTFFLHGSDIT